jgi:hypothetical protein
MTDSQRAALDRAVLPAILLVLAYGVFSCVQFALQDDVRHLLVRVTDDASYFMTTARNIAAGRGMTFDGIHPTNGFHPLWLLVLIPLFLVHGSPETLVRLVVLYQTALLGLASLLLCSAHAKLFSQRAALVSAILFVFLVFLPCINGMESALLILLLVVLYRYGLRISQSPVSGPRALLFGVILGLVLLSRLDMVFLPLAMSGCCVHYLLNRDTRFRVTAALIVAGAGSCAVVIPYLIFNEIQFGAIMPISGTLKSSFPSLALSRGTIGAVGNGHYACLALAIVWLIWRIIRTASPLPKPGDDYYTVSTTVLAWAVILHFLYTILFMRWGVFAWYFVPYKLFAVMLLAGAVDSILKSSFLARAAGAYWAAVAVLFLVAAGRDYTREKYPLNGGWHAPVYDAAVWARGHTAQDAVFAMSDCGHFAFFSTRRVINLDGLANNMDYQRAIAHRHVNQYLQDNHVDYLVQHAVHSRGDVIRGGYDSLALRYESYAYGVVSDAVVVRERDEAYRSPQYFDGPYSSVLLVWSLGHSAALLP